MADIQTQLPIKITDNSNTVAVTAGSALKVDNSAVTQPVSGTVTNVPSGTQTVAGTVTNVPSGTQTVAGTVTNVPSGTQTVAGSTTAVGAKAEDAAHSSGDAGHFVLAVRNDSATATTTTDGDYSQISTDSAGRVGISDLGGSITVDGTVTNVPSGTQTVAGTVTNVPSGTQTVAGTVTTVPSGTQTVAGSFAAGEITSGIVHSYNTSATIANASTGTISYTVTTAKTLYLKGVMASSSGGPCKVVVDTGAGPTVLAVGFYAASSPFLSIPFYQPPAIAGDEVVRIKITNSAGSAQDVYGAIMGHEL